MSFFSAGRVTSRGIQSTVISPYVQKGFTIPFVCWLLNIQLSSILFGG